MQVSYNLELLVQRQALMRGAKPAGLCKGTPKSGSPLYAGELPPTVELRVAEADPYAKGDSATTSHKRCTLEGGARVAVPPYVATGDSVVVDTCDGTFVRRGDGGS